jgi:hypothetical protein
LPKAAPELDAAAKRFEAAPGTARIFVYRLKSVFFGRYDSVIRIDGQDVGAISKGLYVVADVIPGRHVVASTTLLVDGDGVSSCGVGDLAIDTSDAGVYFINVEIAGWPVDPPRIRVVDKLEGVQAVQRSNLAGPWSR